MIETANGYELLRGIGEYGKHEYIVSYTITNFIKQLEDGQMLFWRFVNDQMNIPPEKVTVEIRANMDFTEKNERIWGFGFPGNIEFIEGKVIAENSESLNQDHYVTVLIQFTEEIFQTDDHLYQTFEEVKEKALVGSDYGKNTGSSESSGSLIFTFIPIIIAFMFMMGFIVIVGIVVLFFMRPEVFNVTNQAPGFLGVNKRGILS